MWEGKRLQLDSVLVESQLFKVLNKADVYCSIRTKKKKK